MYPHRLSNSSAAPGSLWDQYDFEMCEGLETGESIWAFFIVLCFALGFPASVAIFCEMFKTYRRGTPLTPSDFLIFNITVMDIFFLAFIPPGVLNHFVMKSWLFEAIWNGVYSLTICGRPFLMACICLDCYLAVVHPITYHQRKSLTPRVVMTGIIWTLTTIYGILFGLFHKLYITVFSYMPFIITIVIISVCDSLILHALVKSDRGRGGIHPQKKRAIQTLINSLVMTVLFYLPPVFLIGIGSHLISDSNVFICNVATPITLTSSMGSVVMPILNLNNRGKFKCFRLQFCKKS